MSSWKGSYLESINYYKIKNFNLKLGLARIFSDFIAVNLAWILWYYLRLNVDLISFLSIESNTILPSIGYLIPFFIFSSIAYILIAMFKGLYRFEIIYSYLWEFIRICLLVALWWLLIVAFYAIWKHQLFFSRILLFSVLVFAIIFLSFFRYLLRLFEKILLKKWIWAQSIFIIWEWDILERIKKSVENLPQYRLKWFEIVFSENADYGNVDIIWYLWQNETEKNKIVNFCQINQIWFSFVAWAKGILISRLRTSMIWRFPLLTVESTPIYGWWKFFKRSADIVVSIFLLLFLFPFFIIISLLIKIDSPWPIFYSSKRVWKNWVLFNMFKLRSMVVDADSLKKDLGEKNQRKWPLFKIKNDPRITKFWKFLRRFSIDEFPQIWNVLKWEMSFVWPRAHLPQEVKNYTPLQRRVLTIEPWITWLAQINWRSDLDFEEEIRLDLQYIVHWSILLDIQVMIQTPVVLLKGEGAD